MQISFPSAFFSPWIQRVSKQTLVFSSRSQVSDSPVNKHLSKKRDWINDISNKAFKNPLPRWVEHAMNIRTTLPWVRPACTLSRQVMSSRAYLRPVPCLFASSEFSVCLSPGGLVLWLYWLKNGIDLLRAFPLPFKWVISVASLRFPRSQVRSSF